MHPVRPPVRARRVVVARLLGVGLGAVAIGSAAIAFAESRISIREVGASGGASASASLRIRVEIAPTLIVVGQPGGASVAGNQGTWVTGCLASSPACRASSQGGAGVNVGAASADADAGAAIASP